MPSALIRPEARGEGRRVAIEVACVLTLGALIVVPSLFSRDPWNPDEPRYVEVAREMVVLGDYILPHLNGEIYSEKPPMFFWLAALFYRAGAGVNAGRMIGGLSAISGLLLVYFFGRRVLPGYGGLLAAAITATALLFTTVAKLGVLDPLLTVFTTGALIAAYCALEPSSTRPRLCWLVFYALMGLGVLTKGPVGCLVPGLPVLVYAVVHRKHLNAGGWVHLAGVVLMFGIICAWLVPAIIRGGPEYTRTILIRQNFGRAVASYSHRHGPFYYLLRLPMFLFPWTLFAALGGVQAAIAWRREGDRAASFLVLWFACVLVFFNLMSGKRHGYLVPLTPAAGLLCARYFATAAKAGVPWPRVHKWFSGLSFVAVALLAVVLAVLLVIGPRIALRVYSKDPSLGPKLAALIGPWTIAAGSSLAAITIVIAVAGVKNSIAGRSVMKQAAILVAAILALSLCMDSVYTPIANKFKSGRRFSAQALPYLQQAQRRFMLGTEFSGVFNLYTGITSMPVIRTVAGLEDALETEERVVVLADARHVRKLFPELPSKTRVLLRGMSGHREMVLISNWE